MHLCHHMYSIALGMGTPRITTDTGKPCIPTSTGCMHSHRYGEATHPPQVWGIHESPEELEIHASPRRCHSPPRGTGMPRTPTGDALHPRGVQVHYDVKVQPARQVWCSQIVSLQGKQIQANSGCF